MLSTDEKIEQIAGELENLLVTASRREWFQKELLGAARQYAEREKKSTAERRECFDATFDAIKNDPALQNPDKEPDKPGEWEWHRISNPDTGERLSGWGRPFNTPDPRFILPFFHRGEKPEELLGERPADVIADRGAYYLLLALCHDAFLANYEPLITKSIKAVWPTLEDEIYQDQRLYNGETSPGVPDFAATGLEIVKFDLASAEKPESQPGAGEENIPIEDKELTILMELNEANEKLLSQTELSAATSIKRGTLKDKLLRLEGVGLVCRPLGKRKGYQITNKGREVCNHNE